jgi:pyruvate kinase
MQPIQIIATIGPATQEISTIQALIESGMSLARLNFSWGTHPEHRRFIENVRAAGRATGVTIPIIQDLSGPRVQEGVSHTFNNDATVVTDKDIADVRAMADLQPEYVALSFVKDAQDIAVLRAELIHAKSKSKIIAKIERPEALTHLDEIIAAVDGVMIARGDLGDAIPFETLPFVKKDILKRCNHAGVPAIVATDMLTSMIDSEHPSRADVSDIAHAVLDGASGTMLSNETAVGKNPVAAVTVMRKVVDEAKRHVGTQVAFF